jgi:16S rRNA C967 or C1407 C5-methylase (RsmB/RsmF family)/NOL1/NOP2/fmu family ribosome biogenesis protein
MFPEEFIKRIVLQEYIDAEGLTAALEHEAPVSIRINPYKWAQPVRQYERVSWEPDGYYLDRRPLFTPDPLFHAGVYYPQEASGMFTGEVFRQVASGAKDIRVLDLCGAPGGKSTHLSALIGGNGMLVANEVIRSRASVLAENITKWGIGNTIVTQNDPSAFAALPGFFDIMVVDAPCSGEGMFRDPMAVREWSEQNARLCNERQRRIVMDAWPALKPGGMMIYSTCTFNPAENEENIAWFKEKAGAESVTIDLNATEGVQPVSYNGIEGYGFYPGRIRGDGFFIAALKKTSDPVRSGQRIKPGTFRQERRAFDLAGPLIRAEHDRIVMIDDRVAVLAADRDITAYIDARLTIIKYGTMIGEVRKDNFVPAHDLAMSVNQRPGAWPVYDASYEEAVTFLRLGQFRLNGMPEGRVMIYYRGIPLGFVNNLGHRFNNGYPQAWRIRMEKQENFSEIL